MKKCDMQNTVPTPTPLGSLKVIAMFCWHNIFYMLSEIWP